MTLLTYPRWRHLVLDLDRWQFEEMWMEQFGCSIYECNTWRDDNGFTIASLIGTQTFSDWDMEYTDQPVLGEKADLEWKGGNALTYAYDLIWQPYWLIDPKTGYPRNFEAILRIEMIKKYMKQNNL